MRNHCIATSVFLALVFTILQGTVLGQTSSVGAGINWTKSVQSLEGYWGDVLEVPYNSFIDTSAVAETLRYLGETGTHYTSAVQWVNITEVSNSDYLLTKLLVLGQAGFDVAAIRGSGARQR